MLIYTKKQEGDKFNGDYFDSHELKNAAMFLVGVPALFYLQSPSGDIGIIAPRENKTFWNQAMIDLANRKIRGTSLSILDRWVQSMIKDGMKRYPEYF